jgi:hypothetical protein
MSWVDFAFEHHFLLLFALLCILAGFDLWRQYSYNHHAYWFYKYAGAVRSREEFWEIGFHLEEMEHKVESQAAFFDQVSGVTEHFSSEIGVGLRGKHDFSKNGGEHFLTWRRARSSIQNLLHNDSSIFQILCGEEGPPLRIGLNEFRTDERDVCNVFTSPTPPSERALREAGPETMYEMVDAGTDGEFFLRVLSNGRFLTVDQLGRNYEWKLLVGGPVAGAAEKFRLSKDGLLFSPIFKGGFTCEAGKTVLGYQGVYNNFNKFIFKEVGSEQIQRGWELADLSRKVHGIQNEYAASRASNAGQIRENANKVIASESGGGSGDMVKLCIAVPMTSKGTDMNSVANSPFFANLFDSFMKSVDWRSNRIQYRFYLGFDKADPMYDTGDAWSEMREEFSRRAAYHMKQQMMDDVDVRDVLSKSLNMRLMHFEHLEGAPTQVVSQLVLKAYSDGYDYFYQVNDDTLIITPNWAPVFIKTLASNPYIPNFGVTGPLDNNNDLIFTHSFTHRTHIEVFGHLFPTSFKNWWSDDWITTVYGAQHTFTKTGVEIKHNVESQKLGGATRYEIDQGAQMRLSDELRKGHVQIDEWLRDKQLPRLPLPVICDYIPSVAPLLEPLRSSKADGDHRADAEALKHHSRGDEAHDFM